MIRHATFSDIPAIEKMVRSTHARSHYAGRCGINDKALEQLLTGLVAGQKQQGPGASFCMVAEESSKVVAFMGGVLNRIYGIGDKLAATDLFLVSRSGNPRHSNLLLDEYIAWARKNPKVLEIGLSWTMAIPKAEAVAKAYERAGAEKFGESYIIYTDADLGQREAA